MKTIVIVMDTFINLWSDNPSSMGGAEVQMKNYLEHLSKYNYIHLLTSEINKSEIPQIKNVTTWPIFSTPRKPRIQRIFRFFGYEIFTMFNILFKLKPDLLITTANNRYITHANYLAWLLRIPRIYRFAHDSSSLGRSIRGSRFIVLPFSIMIKLTKPKLITQHLKQQQNVTHTFCQSSTQIYNSFTLPKTQPLPLSKREFILWVGRYKAFKQPEKFLELAKSMPEKKFMMVCNGTLPNEFHQQIENLDNLEFFSHVPFRRIYDNYYRKAIFFITTSLQEGFPNTIIQAVRAGTPVISYNINPDNLITDHELGIVENDFKNVVKYINKVLENNQKYQEYSENARNYFNTYHSSNQNLSKLDQIVQEINTLSQ